MTYTVRPISDRTPFTGRHQRSPFASAWSTTEELLLREVRLLQGKHLVIEIDVSESQIRVDGRLYARAQAATPAVRVAFESEHGPLTYATDRFWSWQDNVRAIALGLESLRRVDRYGISERGEQYAGFKALPAGRAMPASHMTRTESAVVLERAAIGDEPGPGRERLLERILNDPAYAAEVHKHARRAVHPDHNGGDQSSWDLVEQAARVLGVPGA